MVLPVTVTVIRLITVAGLGGLAITFAWEVTALFVAVAVGLTIMGVGHALCLLGPGWRQPSSADAKPASITGRLP